MDFVAIDVETANPRMNSICQVGVVVFEGGREVLAESKLLDPRDYFDGMNVSIHGIDEDSVRGAPTFSDLHPWLSSVLSDRIVVSHTSFDRVAVAQSCGLQGLAEPVCRWLDSARVARRAWEDVRQSGYGLKNLAKRFEIPLEHHDAVSDARAAGLIVMKAIDDSGLNIDVWTDKAARKISSGGGSGGNRADIRREGDGDGPLLGETIVFTGALQVPRREAADIAHVAGAAVATGVTKKVTMLVVGDQDLDRLAGHSKSSKHRKAEDFIAKGATIRIVGEADFLKACELG